MVGLIIKGIPKVFKMKRINKTKPEIALTESLESLTIRDAILRALASSNKCCFLAN